MCVVELRHSLETVQVRSGLGGKVRDGGDVHGARLAIPAVTDPQNDLAAVQRAERIVRGQREPEGHAGVLGKDGDVGVRGAGDKDRIPAKGGTSAGT